MYLPPFISQIPDFIYWTVLISFFDLSWMAWHWKPAIGNPLSIPTAVYLDDETEEESDSAKLISDDVEDIYNENKQGTKFGTLEKAMFSFFAAIIFWFNGKIEENLPVDYI